MFMQERSIINMRRDFPSLLKYQLQVERSNNPDRSSNVVLEPLERGFGTTLGNSLRRVLLSSIPGAAVTAIKIDSALHEFSHIPGVVEDVAEIVLSMKCLEIKLDGTNKAKAVLSGSGAGVLTAGMIQAPSNVEILNPELKICTLGFDGSVHIEIFIEHGVGYSTVASRVYEDKPVINMIMLDTNFSPIKKVAYKVENTRVGQVTDYDKLTLIVETNGSINPVQAVSNAAALLCEQFRRFVGCENIVDIDIDAEPSAIHNTPDKIALHKVLQKKISSLELSVRAMNCLKNMGLILLGDLVQKEEKYLLLTPNFGKKSLSEIKDVLASFGLHLGMEIGDWPPVSDDSDSHSALDAMEN